MKQALAVGTITLAVILLLTFISIKLFFNDVKHTSLVQEESCNVIIYEIKANDKDIVSSYVNGDTTVVIKITEEGVQVIKSYIQPYN